MNPSESFLRLAWKEYRVQRPLWLTMATLTPIVQAIVAGVSELKIINDSPLTADGQMVVGLAALAVYWLGCGATLFATEHEMGTFDFQRTMPVTAWQVFAAKFAVALSSGVLLGTSLWLITQVAFAHFEARAVDLWIPVVLTAVEVLVWSIFFSLILRQPLWAAVLGVAAPSLLVTLVLPLIRPVPFEFDVFVYHRSYLLVRALLAAVVLLIDFALARPWFEGRLRLPNWANGRRWFGGAGSENDNDYGLTFANDRPLVAYSGAGAVGTRRLIWMAWRQGRWIMLPLWAAYVLTAWGLFGMTLAERDAAWGRLMGPLILSSLAFGLSTFAFDQWGSEFRFYAERGISARRLWTVRQAFWLVPLLAMCGVTAGVASYAHPQQLAPNVSEYRMLWLLCVLIPLGFFAFAQFLAMFVPRTIIAVVTACFTAFLYYVWAGLMTLGDVPVVWSVAPIPLVLLALTVWYAPHWVEGRLDRRAARRILACLVIPSLLVCAGAVARRAWQIPLTDPGFSTSEFERPLDTTERETVTRYWRADLALANLSEKPTEQERAAVIELLRDAHRSPPAPLLADGDGPFNALRQRLPTVDDGQPGKVRVAKSVQFLRDEARRAIKAERLDDAAEFYQIALELLRRAQLRVHVIVARELIFQQEQVLRDVIAWSGHPSLDATKAQAMLNWLDAFERQLPDDRASIQYEYLALRSLCENDASSEASKALLDGGLARGTRFAWTLMPWEAERSSRLLDHVCKQELETYDAWSETVRAGNGPVGWPNLFPTASPLAEWQMTTMSPMLNHAVMAALTSVTRVTSVRSARWHVALRAYHREHDDWPDSLEQLGPTYFERTKLPIDPQNGRMPALFKNGMPFEVTNSEGRKLPPHTPFLWWAGHSNVLYEPADVGPGRFLRTDGRTMPPEFALQMGRVERLERKTAD